MQFHAPVDRGHLIVLGVHKDAPNRTSVECLARWNYVLYKSFNHLRHNTSAQNGEVAVNGIMEQYLREAMDGQVDAQQGHGAAQQAGPAVSSGSSTPARRNPPHPQRAARPKRSPAHTPPGGNHSFFGDHLHIAPGRLGS